MTDTTDLASRTLSEANRQALQTAHKTIGDILDKQNDKETPESDAPGYRLAMANGDNCSSCANLQEGQCKAYEMATSKKYVCDDHEAMTAEMEADNVLMQETAQITYLAEPTAKWFVGLVFGKTFIDMNGRSVSFPVNKKERYLANTLRAIENTRTESGELVGLPIDEISHNKGKSAGRIIGAMLGTLKLKEKTYTVMRFLANWTPIGIELISNNITRGFSPSARIDSEVVLGGSLTNWPATTEDDGIAIMPPVELSQQTEENDMGMTDEDKAFFKDMVTNLETKFDEKLAALKQPAAPTADLQQPEGEVDPAEVQKRMAELQRRDEATELAALRKHEMKAAKERRKQKAVDLSIGLVIGDNAKNIHKGLPVLQADLQAMLEKLPDDQLPAWQNLLLTIQEKGLMDFAEYGHGHIMKGTKQLPAELAEQLQSAIKAGHSIAKWFELADIGDKDEYNLSQFEGGK